MYQNNPGMPYSYQAYQPQSMTNGYNTFPQTTRPYQQLNQQVPSVPQIPQQNQQPNGQAAGLMGRVVDNENDIVYAEIPQDNSIAYFPKRDLTCIYAKQVGQNGVTTTVRYVPEQSEQNQETATDESNVQNMLNNILNRLDDIESMVKQNRKPHYNNRYKKNQNGSNYRKQGVEND